MLDELQKRLKFKTLIKMLSRFSTLFFLSKPHAFDPLRYTQLYNDQFVRANDAAVDDICHEVDVIEQHYKREIVRKIFIIFNTICEIRQETKENKEKKKETVKGNEIPNKFPYLSTILEEYLNSNRELFAKVLQEVITKWINFNDEPEISSEIFDSLFIFDCELENLSEIDYEKLRQEDEFSELCLKALPFFTHLDEDLNQFEESLEHVRKLKVCIQEFFDLPNEKKKEPAKHKHTLNDQDFSCKYIKKAYSLILLLIKINGLMSSQREANKKGIIEANKFIEICYEYLIKSVRSLEQSQGEKHLQVTSQTVAGKLWKFNGYFFTIHWENKLLNKSHAKLLEKVIINS